MLINHWWEPFHNVCVYIHQITTKYTLNILKFCQLYLKAGGGKRTYLEQGKNMRKKIVSESLLTNSACEWFQGKTSLLSPTKDFYQLSVNSIMGFMKSNQ